MVPRMAVDKTKGPKLPDHLLDEITRNSINNGEFAISLWMD